MRLSAVVVPVRTEAGEDGAARRLAEDVGRAAERIDREDAQFLRAEGGVARPTQLLDSERQFHQVDQCQRVVSLVAGVDDVLVDESPRQRCPGGGRIVGLEALRVSEHRRTIESGPTAVRGERRHRAGVAGEVHRRPGAGVRRRPPPGLGKPGPDLVGSDLRILQPREHLGPVHLESHVEAGGQVESTRFGEHCGHLRGVGLRLVQQGLRLEGRDLDHGDGHQLADQGRHLLGGPGGEAEDGSHVAPGVRGAALGDRDAGSHREQVGEVLDRVQEGQLPKGREIGVELESRGLDRPRGVQDLEDGAVLLESAAEELHVLLRRPGPVDVDLAPESPVDFAVELLVGALHEAAGRFEGVVGVLAVDRSRRGDLAGVERGALGLDRGFGPAQGVVRPSLSRGREPDEEEEPGERQREAPAPTGRLGRVSGECHREEVRPGKRVRRGTAGAMRADPAGIVPAVVPTTSPDRPEDSPLVRIGSRVAPRARRLRLQQSQGFLGLAALIVYTALRPGEPAAALAALGEREGPLVFLLLFAFSGILSLLKFRMTEEIFVSPPVLAIVAAIPILGPVTAAWIAVTVSLATRAMAMAGIGPNRIDMDDPGLQGAHLFGLFGTYGLPMVAAGLTFEALGGTFPVREATMVGAVRLGVVLLVFQLLNQAVMLRVQGALGYSWRTRLHLAFVDTGLYLCGLPFTVLIVWTWLGLGLGGLVLTLFLGVLGTLLVRSLATARTANRRLVERLSSLSNVAAAISVGWRRDELLERIYLECSEVIDTAHFSIALLDEESRTLDFELDFARGVRQPSCSLPLGEGLSSWVVENRRPLLIGSYQEENERELSSVDDGVETESWLGVPMVVQDRVIGMISIQNHRRDAFTADDVVLMEAIASQAAAALDASRRFHELQELNVELEERIAERTVELRDANVRLMAADRAKSHFLAHMSHELRTPLNSILGFSGILRTRAADRLEPRFAGFLDNVHESGTHLLELINDLLDLSKIESGKFRLEVESFDVREAVGTVERVIRGIAADSAVELAVAVDESLHRVRLDEGRFKQILLNLLSNAVKFSPRGSTVQLRLELHEARLSPLGRPSVGMLVVDAGPGIGEDEVEKIFEEFYQVADGRSKAKIGTGLGLPLTKRLVELHQGTIRVESRPGEGATFRVDLPLEVDGEPGDGRSTSETGSEPRE